MRKQRSELFEETLSLDQLDLAKKTISGLGADNILHSSGLTWLWGDVGVWKTMEDRTIKQSAQKVIEDEKNYTVVLPLLWNNNTESKRTTLTETKTA